MLFDGDCGVCARLVETARRMDRAARFIFAPHQALPDNDLARYGLSRANCESALQVITRHRRVYAGALAVNYFLWQRWPWRLLLLVVYGLPILLLLEMLGYRLFAANRHRISAWLGLQVCRR